MIVHNKKLGLSINSRDVISDVVTNQSAQSTLQLLKNTAIIETSVVPKVCILTGNYFGWVSKVSDTSLLKDSEEFVKVLT